MPAQPPIPPASRSPYGPDGVPKTFADVTHRVQDAARRMEDATQTGPSIDAPPLNLWPAMFGVALVGYVVGALIHRR